MNLAPAHSNLEIRGLTADSRAVRPGYLFAALPGARADGCEFIADAIGRGATAVLAPAGTRVARQDQAVPILWDERPRRRLALMAARFYGRQPGTLAAVTGTNGKTSVASFTRQIWTALGHRAASLGTLGVQGPDLDRRASLTTPDPVVLHATLAELADDGIAHLALEASSHGLSQSRLDGVRVTAAAFTNLSRDHLDYHGSSKNYLAAKAHLFEVVLPPGGFAVLNADAPELSALEASCTARRHKIVTYGRTGTDIRLDTVETLPSGQRLSLTVRGEAYGIELPLVGDFQAMNALCALGLVLAGGADAEESVQALSNLRAVPGRVHFVASLPNGASVYVDYAHTPDALSSVLSALRPHTGRRLVVVFGCGGERDPGKRPQMGAIAKRLADRVIVTDDNPRAEAAGTIRQEILAACPGAREIGDRGDAIRAAIAELEAGDLLVIAGKGHERVQVVGSEVRPFNDAEVAAAAVRDLEGAS